MLIWRAQHVATGARTTAHKHQRKGLLNDGISSDSHSIVVSFQHFIFGRPKCCRQHLNPKFCHTNFKRHPFQHHLLKVLACSVNRGFVLIWELLLLGSTAVNRFFCSTLYCHCAGVKRQHLFSLKKPGAAASLRVPAQPSCHKLRGAGGDWNAQDSLRQSRQTHRSPTDERIERLRRSVRVDQHRTHTAFPARTT